MFFEREDAFNEEPERYDLSLTEDAFEILCSYLELDQKGRRAVIRLIENEAKRCNDDRQQDPDYDYSVTLERIEYKIGRELDH